MKGIVMSRSLSHGRLLLLIILLFISTSCSLLQSSNDSSANDNGVNNTEVVDTKSLEDVYPSIVKIATLNEDGIEVAYGSGTIIDSKGFILTAYHVVGDNDTEALYNPDGIVKVLLTRDATSDPEFLYYAQVVSTNPRADLAVLRIILLRSSEVPVSCLNLPVLNISTAELKPGQPIRAVGYPRIGASSLTVTSGTVSGFGEYDSSTFTAKAYPTVKIDAQLGRGVSGGAVINENHELVGVPVGGMEDGATDLGYARPISLATQMIKDAAQNPIPGCNGGKAAKLSRDPSTYATYYLKGYVYFLDENGYKQPVDKATVYVFPDDVDVTNDITEDDLKRLILKAYTAEDGFYAEPMKSSDYNQPVSILITRDRQIIFERNRVDLNEYYDDTYDENNFEVNMP
jgi:S1-C subfamily serine protease